MTIKIGVCGCGSFAGGFIALFKAHPLVGEVAIADVAIFTQRQLHGPQSLAALRAGKHASMSTLSCASRALTLKGSRVWAGG